MQYAAYKRVRHKQAFIPPPSTISSAKNSGAFPSASYILRLVSSGLTAMASPNTLALLLVSSLLLSLSAAQVAPPKAAPAKPPTPTKLAPSPAPVPTAKAPTPTTKPVKNCCYRYRNIQVCINPARAVGECQKVCNTTVCCITTGAGLNGTGATPAPAPAPVTMSYGYTSYTPVPPATPGKCCFCYRGIRFCLGPQDRPKRFARCARKVCNKYNVCFAKERC